MLACSVVRQLAAGRQDASWPGLVNTFTSKHQVCPTHRGLAPLHWFQEFYKALQQTQIFNGEIGLHIKPNSSILLLKKKYFSALLGDQIANVSGSKGDFLVHRNRSTFCPKWALRTHTHTSLGGSIFHSWTGITMWGSSVGMIQIGLTIAKLSVENWFPILIDNLRIPAQTPVSSSILLAHHPDPCVWRIRSTNSSPQHSDSAATCPQLVYNWSTLGPQLVYKWSTISPHLVHKWPQLVQKKVSCQL